MSTYGKRLDSGKLLNNSLLLGEVSSTDSERGSRDDGQTDGYTDNEENQDVGQEVDRGPLGRRNVQMTEETTNPGGDDPEDDENEKSGADVVHDGLEVTLVLGALHEGGRATDKGATGRGSDESKGLSALATGGVEDGVADVLVDGERFSGDGRLVAGDDGVSDVVLLVIVLIALALLVLVGVIGVLVPQLLPLGKAFGVLVVADERGIGWDDLTLLDDDLVGDE